MSRIVSAVFILCLAVIAVRAQSTNLLTNPDGAAGLQSWRVFGNASVADCAGFGKCFSINQDAFIFQDVTLPENSTGMYALFIDFASIEQAGEHMGQPYLFGYLMNAGATMDGIVLARLSGQEMAKPITRSCEWSMQFGIFKVIEKTARMRLFLRSGCPKTSASTECVSRFRRPGIFLFNTEDDARSFVTSY